MNLTVLRGGVQTTIQDFGRYGFQNLGVPVSGPMDLYSLRLANMLVGNSNEAALEFALSGPILKLNTEAIISITGANFSPTLDEYPIPQFRPVWVRGGSILRFGLAQGGSRGYLAIRGGIDVPSVMSSRSTCLSAGLGGYKGRALRKNDKLKIEAIKNDRLAEKFRRRCVSGDNIFAPSWSINAMQKVAIGSTTSVRFIPGKHWSQLDIEDQSIFLKSKYKVGKSSDRMGCRLDGKSIQGGSGVSQSEATALGTVQLPPGGQPMILMSDRQTVGGYPRLGEVATVDLPLVAQIPIGESLQFITISLSEAQKLWVLQERKFRLLRSSLIEKMAQL